MKKKIFFAIAIIAISTTAIAAYTSFNTTVEKSTKHDFIEETHLECQGKHCTYTEGCDCSGFAPITGGDEWEKSYCKRCGHHKKYHK